ncbi:hypothetical protein FQR65_LT10859 [Abscondita terminalis]|nr:hypothetical protein FQR65_LT10859 [Abscondita terminalis]
MNQHVVQVFILVFTLTTVFSEKPKIEKKQDYYFNYSPVGFIDENMAVAYNTEPVNNLEDMGFIKSLGNGGFNNMNPVAVVNSPVPVFVPQATPLVVKRPPVAVPNSVRYSVPRSVPISVMNAKLATPIHNVRPAFYSVRKEIPRLGANKIVPSKFSTTYAGKHRHPTNGKVMSNGVVGYAVVNQEVPQYVISGMNDPTGLNYGPVYQEPLNLAAVYDNGQMNSVTAHSYQEPQYVTSNAKYHLGSSRLNDLNNRDPLGLNQYSKSVTYDAGSSKTPGSISTPTNYVAYPVSNTPLNHEQSSSVAQSQYGSSAYSTQSVKSQAYQSTYSPMFNSQEETNESNPVFANYAAMPSSSDNSYDLGRTFSDPNSNQNNYAYYLSGKSHGPDITEPQTSSSNLIGVSYVPSYYSGGW